MKNTRLSRFLSGKIFQLLCLIIVVVAITYIVKPTAFNRMNLRQLMNNITNVMIFVCAVSPLLLCGAIDWSGSAIAICGMLTFALLLWQFPDIPWPIMLIPALLVGSILGYINSLFIVKLNLVAFIVTMVMAIVWSRTAQWIMESRPVMISNKSFYDLSSIALFNVIPLFFILAVVLIALASFILMKTEFGRSVLMCGGNSAAARLAGLNPNRVKTILFVSSGCVATIAGLVYAAQYRMATHMAFAIGTPPHMGAFTGSIIGGVSMFGGTGSLASAAMGVALAQLLSYALTSMGANNWVSGLLNGMLLIIAMSIDSFTRSMMLRRLGVKTSGTRMEKLIAILLVLCAAFTLYA